MAMSHPSALPTHSMRIFRLLHRLGLLTGIMLLFAHPTNAADSQKMLAWRGQEENEEPDGSFDERVHELQGWLRQREAERRESWGNDVVTPENPALRHPSSNYFTDRGYDSRGYRRLNDNTRFRLRSQDWSFGDDGHAGSLRRAGRPIDETGNSAADTGMDFDSTDVVKGESKIRSHHVKRKKRGRRR